MTLTYETDPDMVKMNLPDRRTHSGPTALPGPPGGLQWRKSGCNSGGTQMLIRKV